MTPADLRARVTELEGALQFGHDLIDGDSCGAPWKKDCHEFLKQARAALRAKAKE